MKKLPSPADAKYSPEGENLTQLTDFMCLVRVAKYSTRKPVPNSTVAASSELAPFVDSFELTTFQIYRAGKQFIKLKLNQKRHILTLTLLSPPQVASLFEFWG